MAGRLFFCARLTLCGLLAAAALSGLGGPPGARVYDLFADPEEHDVFFAATDNGIFRTDNGGLSWRPSSFGLTNAGTVVITGAKGRLYAGTTIDGVFLSDNNGTAWQRVSNGLTTLDVRSLAVDPNDPGVLYAGTRNGGIFKTENGGQDWIAVNNGLLLFTPDEGTPVFEGDYTSIAIDPNDSQVLYAVQSSIVVPGNGVLFRSSDGGAQWTHINIRSAGLSLKIDPNDSDTIYVGTNLGLIVTRDRFASTEVPAGLLGASVTDIDIDKSNTDTVYASTRLARTFRSGDRGVTWQPINLGMALGESLSLAVDPHTPATVFAGLNGAGVFRSIDSGAHWELSSDGMFGADIRVIELDPQNSANVLAGAFGGAMFLSQNAGGRWEEARNGFIAVQPHSIAFSPQDPQIVYAGSVNPFSQGNGTLFRSTNGGRDWQSRATGSSIYSVVADPANTERLYVATATGVFRSDDGGNNFTGLNDIDGLGSDALLNWSITDLEMDPGNSNVLYAVGNTFDFFSGRIYQFFKTDNAGGHWQDGGTTPTPLIDIAIDPTDTRRIYIGSSLGMFRNQDAAENDGFEMLTAGLPNGGNVTVTSIDVDAQDNAAVYAATSAGMFKSTNHGSSWTIADTGLQTTLARVVRDDPSNAGTLYAGTFSNGVFKTVDRGATWNPTRNPLTLLPVLSRKGLVGAADFDAEGVAAGEIVSLFALNAGPEAGASAQLDPETGTLPTLLAGVRVFFDGIPAALFFVRSGRIDCQVPFEVAGLGEAEVRIEVDGVESNVITADILDSHPGLFPLVSNSDGTINSESNTASENSFVNLLATGQGLVTPELMSGSPTPAGETLFVPVLPVRVLLGEQELASSASLAPTFVGLLQVNVLLGGLAPGQYELFLEIGGRRSRRGVNIFVGSQSGV
ncbi:MAG: hypothetical protein OXB98_20160 [Bryobacterales bacterium]|nr:hypothetical protein [Bryobacterales bacterium]